MLPIRRKGRRLRRSRKSRGNPEAKDSREVKIKETAGRAVAKIAVKANSVDRVANAGEIQEIRMATSREVSAAINRGVISKVARDKAARDKATSKVDRVRVIRRKVLKHKTVRAVNLREIRPGAINAQTRDRTETTLATGAIIRTEAADRVRKRVTRSEVIRNAGTNAETQIGTILSEAMQTAAIPSDEMRGATRTQATPKETILIEVIPNGEITTIEVTPIETHPGAIPTMAMQEVTAIQNLRISNENNFCIVPVGRSVMGVQRQSRI